MRVADKTATRCLEMEWLDICASARRYRLGSHTSLPSFSYVQGWFAPGTVGPMTSREIPSALENRGVLFWLFLEQKKNKGNEEFGRETRSRIGLITSAVRVTCRCGSRVLADDRSDSAKSKCQNHNNERPSQATLVLLTGPFCTLNFSLCILHWRWFAFELTSGRRERPWWSSPAHFALCILHFSLASVYPRAHPGAAAIA
jgi:hypothetical protein